MRIPLPISTAAGKITDFFHKNTNPFFVQQMLTLYTNGTVILRRNSPQKDLSVEERTVLSVFCMVY